MFRIRPRTLLVTALLTTMASAWAADVTIYRCTDTHGRLTLRDTPCRKGERQQTREMLRPSDPAPRPTAKLTPAAAPPAVAAPPRVIVVHAPRPLYECVIDDGERYASDSGEGNPRWVPLWTLGYPDWSHRDSSGSGRFENRGLQARIGGRFDNGRFDVRIGDRAGSRLGAPMPRSPPDRPGPPSRPPLFGQAYPGGTWVRDECYPLPAQEVCDRLRDRRYALDRRYNSALQSERAQITTEQRGIDARLATDCGAY